MSNSFPLTAPRRNHSMRAATALLMGTVLVGCAAPGSGPGVSRYEPTYLRLTEERAFAQALRRHYLELATNAFDRGDVARSDFYSLRALMAAEGKLAQPGQASNQVDTTGEAAAAGERLSMLLMTGARTGSPDLAARAQAAYDCWLVEMGPAGDAQIAASCRFNTLNALAELDGASTGAQLVTAGGPLQPQGQTYVIEPGMPSQTMSAHGVTIEVISHQGSYAAPQGYVQQTYAPQPATYATVEQAAPAYTVATVPAPMAIEAMPAPMAVETVPMMAEPIEMAAFEPAPMMMQQPMMQEPMMEDVGAPMNIIPMPMQATMIEEPAMQFVTTNPIPASVMMEMPASPQQTIDLGSIPVFDTAPVETMPMVEMASLPMTQDSAVEALMQASLNQDTDFSIFFGFDSDAVTLEAEDVLIDTVEQIRLSGATRIGLMGYTDSVGDARYNQLLAMRRAQSVRKYLQDALGTAVTFEILPVGEVQAVQNGGDGVKEALNRKVEISIR